jgi:truncated hemoglobin YjbI
MVDWHQLAVAKAEELGAADPEGAALLILRAIDPQQMVDEACITRQHGVPPPPGEDERCVDYERHSDLFDDGQEALDAWREGRVDEDHRLNQVYPCQDVLDDAKEMFLTTITQAWGIFEPGQLLDHLNYIQEHIKGVPAKLQEKWNIEFIALFGRAKTFAELEPEEASWLRQRLADYVATTPKAARKRRRRPKQSK